MVTGDGNGVGGGRLAKGGLKMAETMALVPEVAMAGVGRKGGKGWRLG